jgi:hypothetical protein
MLYIDDLIQKLIKIKNEKGKLEVCKIGHYGEINEMSINDITVDTGIDYNEAKGYYKERKVVDIDTPHIESISN